MKEEEEELSIDEAKKVQMSEKDAYEVLIAIEKMKSYIIGLIFNNYLSISNKDGFLLQTKISRSMRFFVKVNFSQ
ncbi:hypothetical protein KJJ93_30260, partial [Escherichia coli]|uniref:hypothetical protein n=1 Tax=Escherichia coli TaxID=562 RepID=UPI001BD9BB02